MKNSVFIRGLAALAVALLALLPVSLSAAPKKAGPIVVSINDVPNGAPVIQVDGAPNRYDVYTGVGVATPGIEDGALITLIGVDQSGLIPDWGGRFVVPAAPNPLRTAVDIVWVQHDEDVIGNGDLQIGFNSALPGTFYFNPELRGDDNLGLVTDKWVTVYATDTLVIRYKPHTYRLTVERPFKGSAAVTEASANPDGTGTFEIVGTATHLGKFVSNVSYQVTGVGSGGLQVFVHLWGNFTAANGDTVDIEIPAWVLDYSVTPPTSTGVANIIGGTGRFANASGSYVANISPADAAPGVTQIWTAEGTISY